MLYSFFMATIDDFGKLDIRVGKITDVQDFPEARKPAYKLTIDFGSAVRGSEEPSGSRREIGTKRSSVQVVKNYSKEVLMGKQVIGVVNFPPRQIGPFFSEVLTLGVPDANGEVILLQPDREVPVGGRMY